MKHLERSYSVEATRSRRVKLYEVGFLALGFFVCGSSVCSLRDEEFVFRVEDLVFRVEVGILRGAGCLRERAPVVMELLPLPRDMTHAGSTSSECMEARA